MSTTRFEWTDLRSHDRMRPSAFACAAAAGIQTPIFAAAGVAPVPTAGITTDYRPDSTSTSTSNGTKGTSPGLRSSSPPV